MSRRRSATARVVLLSLYSFGILYLGTRRRLDFPGDAVLSYDKALHALVFGGLALTAFGCVRLIWSTHSSQWSAWVSIAFATALGLLLEIIQSYLPYRSLEFADLLADFCGAVFMVTLARRCNSDRRPRCTKA